MSFWPDRPIVQAPMAGGPSCPALAAAVSSAGGLGFLAAGYKTPDAVAAELDAIPSGVPVGVNVFAPVAGPADPAVVAAYAARIATGPSPPAAGPSPSAAATPSATATPSDLAAVSPPGAPRFDDDAFGAKVALLVDRAPAVVSFAFGLPDAATIGALAAAGSAVWVTVTTPGEAVAAAQAGADAVIAQGAEAGGHRGGFADTGEEPLGLLALLQLVRAATDVPVVAAGGIATAAGVAAVLACGARAAQVGSAFLRCPEAGTSDPHRAQIGTGRATGLTRAWSGRTARGIVNRFQAAHPDAPAAYPELHHLTSPLRAAARAAGDAEGVNLWAGQAHPLARAMPAADVVAALAPG